MSKLITYKGTDANMKCHGGFQYELGKEYKDDGAIRCGDKWDIVEVKRSTRSYLLPTDEYCKFETVYKEVKRMTMQEAIDILSQYFGCPVEIKEETV